MKVFLLGNGKLGALVQREAIKRGHEIVGVGTSSCASLDKIPLADICIDCTTADALEKNISSIIAYKKPLVVATTGIETLMPLLKEHFKDVGCLISPNFSLGFGVFYRIVKEAAQFADSFDIAGIESHHNKKRDAPSGSAKQLQTLFSKDVPFSSIRVGTCPGTHTLYFDGEDDVMTLTHQAKGRDGFARGAVIGAEWLLNKKGFFTMEDFIDDRLS